MKKGIIAIMMYVLLYVSLFFVYPIIASIFLKHPIIQILADLFVALPFSFFILLFVALFLYLAIWLFLCFLELRKAKNAYINARNRIGFIKDGQVVCFEGEIEPQEGLSPLISPISRTPSVLYCYGSNQIGGGASQINTVIKPSGESIPLNGWLSGQYVDKKEYDPLKTNLQHLFSFMMERKDSEVKKQDISRAPFFYEITPGSSQRYTFTNHKILNTLSKDEFNKYKYTEIVIPTGIYGWALGRWDNKNKQLLPLKFSSYIYVIQKDYKKSFLQYISKYRKNYLLGVLLLIFLSIIISLPMLGAAIFGNISNI